MRARLLPVSTPTRPPRATMTPRLPPGWEQTSQLVSCSDESGAPVTCAEAESSAGRRLRRVSTPPSEWNCRHKNRCRPLPPPSKQPLTQPLPPHHLRQGSRSETPLHLCRLLDIICHRSRPATFSGLPHATALPAGAPPRQRRGRAHQSRHVGHGRMCVGLSA